MKVCNGLLIFFEQHNQSPDGMNEHEEDRDQPSNAMNIECHSAHIFEHHPGSPGVAYQSQYEEKQISGLEAAGNALAPNANRVKNQCYCNDDTRG